MRGDPVRLVDAESEASEPLRAVLRGGGGATPSQAQLDSLASKLGPILGAAAGGAAVGAAASSAASGSAASGGAGLGLGAKVVAGVVLVGALAGGGAWLAQRDSARDATPAAKAAPNAPSRAAARAEPGPPSTAPAPVAGDAVHAESARTAPTPKSAALKESELLEAAQRALSTNPERALALTQTHRQRFPNGALAQEREVIAIEALSRLGRKADAKRQSEEFEKAYPGSAHRRKVESALEP